jgi:3-hydroxy acid dehydrogenase/malonic semialdehyde reductase
MKTILVTGATAGFGATFARRFVKDGHRVIATGRRVERLKELAQELGPAVLPLALDMTDATAVDGFVDSLPEGWRQIDVLVNNAGLALGLGPAWESDLSDWDRMIATNVSGLVHLTRAVLPQMVARNDGLIINLGSVAGDYPYPGGHVYGATKAFVLQFSLNLRADLAGLNVRVTNIEPGMVTGSEFSKVLRRRRVQGRGRLCRDQIADAGRHCRYRRLAGRTAPTCQYQPDRNDADLSGRRPVHG